MKKNALALAVLLALIAGACGGGGDSAPSTSQADAELTETSSVAPDGSDDSDSSGDSNGPADTPDGGGGDGVIEAGDETFAVDRLGRCDPLFSDREGNLSVTGLSGTTGLEVTITVSSGFVRHGLFFQSSGTSVSGMYRNSATSIADGDWSDDNEKVVPGPPFTLEGDRISGSMTVYDTEGSGESFDISFDLRVPSQLDDC